jgi:hypothetical protein
LRKNYEKWSSGWKNMTLQGWEVKRVFSKVLGLFVDFLSGWKLRSKRAGALAMFGKFLGIIGEFW